MTDGSAQDDRPPRARVSVLRRLLGRMALVLLPLGVLLLLVEGLLWGLDLGRLPHHAGFSRGFDPGARQLVPERSQRGAWRTNLHGEGHEVFIPPRDARRRVLLLGGSNTEQMPEQLLQRELDELQPDSWEIVNLGRQGYGSRRVLNLLDQALVLAPDVVVIYSGHNEFVERIFEQELTDAWGSAWERRLGEWLSGLRLFGVLAETLAPLQAIRLDRMPPADRQLQWSETLQRRAAYEQNLEAMCRLAREAGASVLLCTLVGNPLSPPYAATWAEGTDPALIERCDALWREAQTLIPRQAREHLRPPTRLRARSWYGAVPNPSPTPRAVLRPLLGELAVAPALAHAEVGSVQGAHWPPPCDWQPEVVGLLTTLAWCTRPELTAADVERLGRARELLGEALDLAPDQPGVLYDFGLASWLLGAGTQAAVAFRAAACWDRAPNSVNDSMNAIVREVARAEAGVTLLDVDAWVTERCPDRLVGYEVMMDACHLQPGVRVILMHLLAQALLELPQEAAR